MLLDIRDMFDDFYEEEIDIKEKEGFSSDNVFSSTVNMIKENEMNKNKRKIFSIPILAFSIIMMVSVSVFAAYKFLTPKDVANLFNDSKLSQNFTKDYTLSIKEQTSGKYTAKILGIVSGKKLSSYTNTNEDKSYIVGAIAKKDGTKIKDYIDNIMLTPLIEGYKPWEVNIFTLNGSSSKFIEDGIQYFIYECDNLELFANNKIYIALYEGISPNKSIFTYQKDGSISFNKDYKGFKALFNIPLDKSKADPKKAKQLLKNNKLSSDTNEDNIDEDDSDYTTTKEYTKDEVQFTIQEKK